MKRTAFIINPFAAKGGAKSVLAELKNKFENLNYYVSDSLEGTHRFIDDNFAATDIFVAVGGDGTISSVAQKLINTEKILAIVPAGSGNGFSRETHFTHNIDDLLQKIERLDTRKIDAFSVNGHLSVNVSGVGFDSMVVKEFEKTDRGFLNYVKVSIKTFFSYRPVEIIFDEKKFKQYSGRYLMMNLANTRQFGNNAFIAPMASKSDGLVDVVLVKKFPLSYALTFAYRMFRKTLRDDRYVQYLSVPRLSFSVDTALWHVDGDFRQIPSPVEVEVLPGSLRVLTE